MISIPGGILSALIDEANTSASVGVQQGLLYGNKSCKRTEVLSDTQEDRVVDEYQIAITGFLNMREHHPFWNSNKFEKPAVVNDRDDVVGLLVIRRDGVKSPSLRDVFVARHLCDLESSKIYPFLVLLINIDCGQRSWVYGMHYSCFGVLRDCPKSLIPLDLCVPSLSPDSAADYKSSSCINSDSTISLYIGEKSAALMSHAAATAINQSVETELVASQLIDDIKETALTVTSLEMELIQLRRKVEAARQGKKLQPI